MKIAPATREEIEARLTQLPGWAHHRDALEKTYTFANFREAFAFMTRAAFEAEALDHHPEWTNVYNRVSIRLTTHDAGNRVTQRDFDLAARLEKLGVAPR